MTDEPARSAESAEDAPDYEELLLRAGFNFHVFLAAALGFVRDHGADAGQFIRWTAARLAPTWAGLRGHGADAVLRLVLENLAATGYAIGAVELGADEAHAEVRSVPLGLDAPAWRQIVAPFAVTPAEMRRLFDVFAPLAATADTQLEIGGTDESVTLTVRRRRPQPPIQADLAGG